MALWLAHDPEARRITGSRHAVEMLRLKPGSNISLTAPQPERPGHFRLLQQNREVAPEDLPVQRAARGEIVHEEEFRIVFDDGTYFDELCSARPVRVRITFLATTVATTSSRRQNR